GAAAAPADPAKTGYTFDGWDKVFDNITGDLTVNAKWKTNTYTVTFKDGDTVLKTQPVEYGGAAAAPADPAKTGYTFDGWDKVFDNITGDLTVNAKWQINTYTVIFKDGETVLKTQPVDYGGAAAAPADPAKTGYTFDGWDKAFDNITGDLTVNAQYTAKNVTGVELSNGSLTLEPEKTFRLTASVVPADAADKNVTWSSSDPTVATVSADGLVTALKPGTATVTATTADGEFTAGCVVTVKVSQTVRLEDEETGLKLEAEEGVLPPDTVMEVAVLDPDETDKCFKIINNAEQNTSDKIIAFDITLISNGTEIQPNGLVKITIPVPVGFNKQKMVLFHVADDGTLTKIPFTLDSNSKNMTFYVSHFSVYAIVETITPSYPLGHISGGDRLSVNDARLLLQYLVGKIQLTPEQLDAANVTGGDKVSINDARCILQKLVDKITVFPRELQTTVPSQSAQQVIEPPVEYAVDRKQVV
ncbi:MAG: InlB B-repeat-containing protein, partial [Oscillospiraceae bacterium]|nr:InlB B-repeat-containing protein [Oscillospiraceae bacterium]